MPKRYDATTKQLVEAFPADWLAYAGLPVAGPVTVIDADVSAVTAAADKVIRVGGPAPYVAHLEFQASADARLDRRVLVYNALLRDRHGLPVRSVAVLLRPEAGSPGAVGRVLDQDGGPAFRLDFAYKVVRVWEQSSAALLAGGLGTVPLAPLAARGADEVPVIYDGIGHRLAEGVAPATANELWAASFILTGLRYQGAVLEALLRGVRQMRESASYQMILEEGRTAGEATEARRMLVRLGTAKFGAPDPTTAAALDAIADVGRLEDLAERVLSAGSWRELMG